MVPASSTSGALAGRGALTSVLFMSSLLAACDRAPEPTAQSSDAADTVDSVTTIVGLGCRTDAVEPRELDPAATFPTAPTAGAPHGRNVGEYGQYGAEIYAEIWPVIGGVPTEDARASLMAAGWTITIADATSGADSTITPDLRWDRLVLVSCRGRVAGFGFD